MKKTLSILAGFLTFCACTEQISENEVHEGTSIQATITPQTRTAMGPKEEGIYKVLWTQGDGIVVSDGYIDAVFMTDSDHSTSAVFIPKTKVTMDFSKGVIAGYPVEGMFLAGPDVEENIYFTIPNIQQYAEGSFTEETMPMISDVAYEPVLTFRNAASVMKLTVSGEEEVTITSISVSSNETISGDLCYNPGSDSYIPEEVMTPYTSTTLDCGEGVVVGKDGADFHIVIPHQTYTGLTITLTASDGRKHVFKMKEGKEIAAARGSVLTIPLTFSTFGTSTKPEVNLSYSSVSFSGFSISVSMKNVTSYYCGLQSRSSFENEMKDGSLFEVLNWKTEYTTPLSYSGSVLRFQEEMQDVLIEPGHDYVFWIVPKNETGSYTATDVTYIEVSTKSYTAGGSISLSASDPTIDMTSISLTLTASGSVEMIYNMLLSENEIAKFPTEQDKIDLLIGGSAYFFDRSSDVVIRKFLSPGTKYTLLAIAVDRYGRYGPLFMQEYQTVDLPYNGTKVIIDQDITSLRADQTIRWSMTGGNDVEEYLYIFTDTDRHLWTGTLESSVRKAGETMFLNPGLYYITRTKENSAKVSMENGKEYMFVILAVDKAGNCSTASSWKFTY
ncbi:MAG: hypothetical protein IKU36_01245 [Bacteroidales bacterium]|nr:hypothetical protein [Bacteroidales bacterium]